jgi:hypothetical protein
MSEESIKEARDESKSIKRKVLRVVEEDVNLPIPIPIPTEPQVGDDVIKEGYIWWYRVKDSVFVTPNSSTSFVELHLDMNTSFVVNISERNDSEVNPLQFRILYKDLSGEQLAFSMTKVAVLKDAFAHGSKVRVYGQVTEYEITYMFPQTTNYNTLRAVDVIR